MNLPSTDLGVCVCVHLLVGGPLYARQRCLPVHDGQGQKLGASEIISSPRQVVVARCACMYV